MKNLFCVLPVLMLLLCASCNQDDYITIITDGSEAATVVGVLALETTLPAEAAMIIAGMKTVDQTALDILAGTNTANTTLTLQQLLNLAFSNDLQLARYQAIIAFVLPILDDIPGISEAMTSLVSDCNPTVIADVKAFFTGMVTGLGDAPGTTAQQVIDRSPKLKNAIKNSGTGKFNPGNLINNLKAALVKR